MSRPELYIVGGPNGAGKTTVARQLLNSAPIEFEYLGADAIAAELSPENPTGAQVAAGREFLRRSRNCLESRRNCLLESTLSGKTLRRVLEKAKSLDYRIQVHFLYIDSVELSLARVRQRVAKGGHDVPAADILRRFPRTFTNFWQIYRHFADCWVITYNAQVAATDVAFGDAQSRFICNQELFDKFLEIVGRDHASDQ